MLLTRQVFFAAALLASVPVTAGQEAAIAVFNQLSSDYMDCFSYHLVSKQCASKTATEAELAQVQNMAQVAKEGAVVIGKTIGMSDEALAARLKLSMESVVQLIQNDCVNIDVLLVKYATFCQELEQSPGAARARAPRASETLSVAHTARPEVPLVLGRRISPTIPCRQ
jgi:hypothetical protein